MGFEGVRLGIAPIGWTNDDMLGLMSQVGAIPTPQHTET